MTALTNRTTYRNRRGDIVHIAGPTQCAPVQGLKTFWSIQGDHYAEDGRFVACRRSPNPDPEAAQEWPYVYEAYLAFDTSPRTIIAIEDTDGARDWWKNVQA